MTELQQRILEALEAGRHDEVRRLQALYRSTAVVASGARARVQPIRLIEKPARTTTSKMQLRKPQEDAGAATLLRDAVPVFRVELGERRREIEREIHDAHHLHGGKRLESGGWLYAVRPPDERGVVLAFASGPGRGARHQETSVDLGAPETFEDFLGRAVGICGCWHVHDVPGVTWPGRDDLDGFAAGLREHRVSSWVSLIATPADDGTGWMYPRLSAWRTYRNRAGDLVCEPALVEGD